MRRRNEISRFRISENLLSCIRGIHIVQLYVYIPYTYSTGFIRVELVRDGLGNQKVRADLFNIFVEQPSLALNVVFGGSIFLAELGEEGSDPFRPMHGVCISNWFRKSAVLL